MRLKLFVSSTKALFAFFTVLIFAVGLGKMLATNSAGSESQLPAPDSCFLPMKTLGRGAGVSSYWVSAHIGETCFSDE